MMIAQKVMKWQQFFEFQDGGDHHLEFLKICIFDVIDMFQIQGLLFPLILVVIGQIVKNGSSFSKS